MYYNHSKLTARLVDLSLVELVRLHYQVYQHAEFITSGRGNTLGP